MILGAELNQIEMKKQEMILNENINRIIEKANEDDLLVPVSEIFKGTCFAGKFKDYGFIIRKGEG